MSSSKKTAVLVAERDGDWSAWVEPLRDQADDIAIVLQRMGESPSELATRVRERVEEVSRSGSVVAAALVGGDRWDAEILSSRSLIIRALSTRMAPGTEAQLFLDAGAKNGRGRHAMQALASVVSEEVDDSVSVVTTRGPLPAPRRAA